MPWRRSCAARRRGDPAVQHLIKHGDIVLTKIAKIPSGTRTDEDRALAFCRVEILRNFALGADVAVGPVSEVDDRYASASFSVHCGFTL